MPYKMISPEYERLMQIEEGTFVVKMFDMDAVFNQAEYDREAEIAEMWDLWANAHMEGE